MLADFTINHWWSIVNDRRSWQSIVLTIGSRSLWSSPLDDLDRWWSIIMIVGDIQLWTSLSSNEHLNRRLIIIIVNNRPSCLLTNVRNDGQWPIVVTNCHDGCLSSPMLHKLFLLSLNSKHYSSPWITFFF